VRGPDTENEVVQLRFRDVPVEAFNAQKWNRLFTAVQLEDAATVPLPAGLSQKYPNRALRPIESTFSLGAGGHFPWCKAVKA